MVPILPPGILLRLDASRVLATSAALLLHAVALLLLLLPLAQGSLPLPRKAPEERWQVREIRPLPPFPPRPVEPVSPPQQTTVPHPTRQPSPIQVPAVIDQGTLAATPLDLATGDTGLDPADPPVTPAHATLRYAVAPPPAYPRDALRAGAQGTVLLRVLVDVDGRPMQVAVERSSGHRSLDREALRQVQQKWRFVPAEAGGQPVQAWGLVPIDFSLQ